MTRACSSRGGGETGGYVAQAFECGGGLMGSHRGLGVNLCLSEMLLAVGWGVGLITRNSSLEPE